LRRFGFHVSDLDHPQKTQNAQNDVLAYAGRDGSASASWIISCFMGCGAGDEAAHFHFVLFSLRGAEARRQARPPKLGDPRKPGHDGVSHGLPVGYHRSTGFVFSESFGRRGCAAPMAIAHAHSHMGAFWTAYVTAATDHGIGGSRFGHAMAELACAGEH
jgi:hypothetical protein